MRYQKYDLPQLRGDIFLTDSGLETYLVFQRGIELPEFAAFTLLESPQGLAEILTYTERHIEIALSYGLGFILATPTWRSNPDWGAKLGYDREGLAKVNGDAVHLMATLRARHETPNSEMPISGDIGPRGDGYAPAQLLEPAESATYHHAQIAAFAEAGADLVTALTMTHAGEAVGIARAASMVGIPVVISFTAETDGRLPTGQPLNEAIEEVDALTDETPAYYMVNCAHPTHLEDVFRNDGARIGRLRGLRANASAKSHAELDCCTELDQGDPVELGRQYRNILRLLPQINVVGGCCGTDHRHIEEICAACTALAA
jgi:S-methylmethionine-dependent homocysteine/selenocysteine methylase